ncbi:FMN-linked oxidoreductase [Leucogyrophana mollusca]|uniref:FMN-linked oxidoreductase n=1 Tax=Leucogyrophana mollusca TaxID=85980 RepID=A0ACB8BSE9_9AGAM|nr:FMN-linked oxidoreductase [Leucogyrophana mollusca]
MQSIANKRAHAIPYFTPAQVTAAGTAFDPQPDGKPIPKLFQPIKIRGTTFHNRLFLSPLCQYSADNGHLTGWHQAFLGGVFIQGPGLSIIEGTAVLPEARITPEDSGLWQDSQIEPLRKIVEFAHSQNQKVGIQLAHAGWKASTVAPWLHPGLTATEAVGGWPENVWSVTDKPFSPSHPTPKQLTKRGITAIVAAFAAAAKRAVQAGIDVIEIHGAHGFLLSSFMSPISNTRTDEYGGTFENRVRLALEVVDAVRSVIPQDMPLFFRISATEWLEESLPNVPSWRIEDTIKFASILAEHGIDLLDVSSGGTHPKAVIKGGVAYQAPLSQAVKDAVGNKILVSAVGSIANGRTAQSVLDKGQSDVIFVGRQFQKNPGSVWEFARDLGVTIKLSHQIEWGFTGRGILPATPQTDRTSA